MRVRNQSPVCKGPGPIPSQKPLDVYDKALFVQVQAVLNDASKRLSPYTQYSELVGTIRVVLDRVQERLIPPKVFNGKAGRGITGRPRNQSPKTEVKATAKISVVEADTDEEVSEEF